MNGLVAAVKAEPSVSVVVLTGVLLVFFILVLIMLLIQLQGKLFQALEQKKHKAAQPMPTLADEQPPVIEEGISEEVVAAIGAAVAAMSPNFQVKTIRKAKPPLQIPSSQWEQAGRWENTAPFEQ